MSRVEFATTLLAALLLVSVAQVVWWLYKKEMEGTLDPWDFGIGLGMVVAVAAFLFFIVLPTIYESPD